MAKLALFMMVSLDGFFEGPNHDLSWHNVDAEFNDFASRQLDEAGTLLFGRRTYDLMACFWPKPIGKKDDPVIAAKMNSLSKLVFSRQNLQPDWEHTKLIKSDLAERLTKLKSLSGKDLLVLGSSNLCVTLLELGLLDELRLMINPVAIGTGTALFAGLRDPLELSLEDRHTFTSNNILLTYRPVKRHD